MNPRRRRSKRRRRRERHERELLALLHALLPEPFVVHDADDDTDDGATLWCITFGDHP